MDPVGGPEPPSSKGRTALASETEPLGILLGKGVGHPCLDRRPCHRRIPPAEGLLGPLAFLEAPMKRKVSRGLTALLLLCSGVQAWAQESWSTTSTSGAPTARTRSTAVWTGREMIVWGGQGVGLPLATGARYDPVSDAWTALPSAGAPTARYDHAAIWTGREMIVWGGWDGTTPANTGARYNPVSNTWTALTTTGAPTARREPSAVWTGRELLVWGGTSGVVQNTGGKYDPSTGVWTPITVTNSPVARSRHTAVWAGGRMIVWGGWDGSSSMGTGSSY